MKKFFWILMAVLAILIGLYPATYFLVDRTFGLLSTKSEALLSDVLWNIAFYIHIVLGAVALMTGWTQFSTQWRIQHLTLHRAVGKVYVSSMTLSALAGIYIGLFATAGLVAVLGFVSLGIVSLVSTVSAYQEARRGHIEKHQSRMVYSYALCFAAVTLRLWLPLLSFCMGGFEQAYRIVAWLCWVPNMVAAVWINRHS
jgi:uncharacterized membrane protein